MSALRQPDFPAEYYSPRMPLHKIAHPPQVTGSQTLTNAIEVVKPKSFSSSNTLPNKFKALSLLQKASFGLAIASMTTSIGVYISTVRIPKLWSQEYQHLENLQRQERQLIAINETIKYQIAYEARQDSNLSVSMPESAVFVTPAKVEPRRKNSIGKDKQTIQKLKHKNYGY
jgi:hypothetical protein